MSFYSNGRDYYFNKDKVSQHGHLHQDYKHISNNDYWSLELCFLHLNDCLSNTSLAAGTPTCNVYVLLEECKLLR